MPSDTNPSAAAQPTILIVGAAGQVGVELRRSFAGVANMVAADRSLVEGSEPLDLADEAQTRALVRRVRPDVIVNAAAYTAVDRAESEPELARLINAQAPAILAEEARALGALFVHYSTDYVFNGGKQQPWVESDSTDPLNVYGQTKLEGEQAVERVGGRFLIFRTSWVYGPHGKNFLLTMLKLAGERPSLSIVSDQIGAPTTSIELARITHEAVDAVLSGRLGPAENWAGLYHTTCGGSTSWFGFAEAIFARAATRGVQSPELKPLPTSGYPTPARRPANSVLSNEKLAAKLGLRLASWQQALDDVFAVLAAPGQ